MKTKISRNIKSVIRSVAFLIAILNAHFATGQWTTGATSITTPNDVGIGVTAPLEKLHIDGNIRGGLTGGAVRISTAFGMLDLGPQSLSYCNIETGLPAFYFNKPLVVNSSIGTNQLTNLELFTNNVVRLRINANSGVLTNPNEAFQIGVADGSVAIRLDNSTGEVRILPTPGSGTFIFSVNGAMRAREIFVNLDDWPDYVFDKKYKLLSLPELEKFILKNKHLPGVPTQSNVVGGEGISVGETQKVLFEKVEELTLYIIKLNKEIETLKANNNIKN